MVGGAPGAQLLFSGSKAADTGHGNTGVNGVHLGNSRHLYRKRKLGLTVKQLGVGGNRQHRYRG